MRQPKTSTVSKHKRARQLPPDSATTASPSAPPAHGSGSTEERIDHLRLRRVQREQVTPVPARLEALLPPDHLARLIWEAVARLELMAFYDAIVVVEDGPGQAATDPQILVAVWTYATS